jgi:tRNA dimethylallyltransferase
MNWEQKKLIVIAGPTAVGKTALSIRLAKYWATEIVSADSRQIYKELNIGTAKPSALELREVVHHFINNVSIHERYDAARYGEEALMVISKLFERHQHVIVCGGSGLYLKALLEGFDHIPTIDNSFRIEINEAYETHGLSWLQQKLALEDPLAWETIEKQNTHRLMRALEVKRATGKSIREFQRHEKKILPFNVIKISLDLPRELLYQRIDQRVDQMIANGLFDEARELYPLKHLQALQTVGYQEIFGHWDGNYDRGEAIRLLKRNTRHYAKRQLTWFRRDLEMIWKSPDDFEEIIKLTEQ